MHPAKQGESSKTFQCAKCNKICKSSSGLANHERSHVGDQASNPPTQFLTCGVCFKQFKSRSNLLKHQEAHTLSSSGTNGQSGVHQESSVGGDCPPPPSASGPSSSGDDFWNDDLIRHFEEHGDEFFVGDDEEEDSLREALVSGAGESGAQTTSNPGESSNVLLRCKDCSSGFKSVDAYLSHRMRHALQAAYAQAPSKETVQKHWRTLSECVVTDIIKTELQSTVSLELTQAAATLKENVQSGDAQTFFSEVCSTLMQCFESKRDFFLVSKLMETYQIHVAAVSVDKEIRSKLMGILESQVPLPLNIREIFLSALLRRFSRGLLAFIIRHITKGESGEVTDLTDKYVMRVENTNTAEFQNVMHYIGGSNVRSILKRLLRIRNPSEETENLLFAIRNNFLITSFSDSPEAELRAWTDAQDRGGLTKITSDMLSFFVALGNTVKGLERANGSLLTEDVINTVCATKSLVFMWDDIIKQTLSENESFNLLYALVLQFCVTWRKGIVSRRMDQFKRSNAVTNSTSGGVAFRAKLA